MPQIVLLDDYAIEEGDLDWSPLAELGAVTRYGRTAYGEIVPRIGTAEYVIANRARIDDTVLDACPALRWVCLLYTSTPGPAPRRTDGAAPRPPAAGPYPPCGDPSGR